MEEKPKCTSDWDIDFSCWEKPKPRKRASKLLAYCKRCLSPNQDWTLVFISVLWGAIIIALVALALFHPPQGMNSVPFENQFHGNAWRFH